MAIYKNISCKVIIRKVFRDLNVNTDNWIHDAVEWVGEALEHIGSATQTEKKVKTVVISDYRGALPSDLYYVNMVAVNNFVHPSFNTELTTLIAKANSIITTLQENPNQNLTYQLRDLNARIVILENLYTANENNLSPLAKCTGEFPVDADCTDCNNAQAVGDSCYYIEGGKIKTSFASGVVCVSYQAFPTDEDCFPLVPDDISFKEALFWYIYKKLLLGGLPPSINGIDYNYADNQWKYYCTQARNQANFPDIDDYESFFNSWVRLVPEVNNHSTFFQDLGKREDLNRGYAID